MKYKIEITLANIVLIRQYYKEDISNNSSKDCTDIVSIIIQNVTLSALRSPDDKIIVMFYKTMTLGEVCTDSISQIPFRKSTEIVISN